MYLSTQHVSRHIESICTSKGPLIVELCVVVITVHIHYHVPYKFTYYVRICISCTAVTVGTENINVLLK